MTRLKKFLNSSFNYFKKLDKKILSTIKKCLVFPFILSIISTVLLLTYTLYIPSPALFLAGITFLKIGLILSVETIICGFSMQIIVNNF